MCRHGSVTSSYRYAAYAYAPVWLYVSEHWQVKKKVIADWLFSLLAGEVTGEWAQPGTAREKPNGDPESTNEQRSMGPDSHHSTNEPGASLGIFSQVVFCCDPTGWSQNTAWKWSLFRYPRVALGAAASHPCMSVYLQCYQGAEVC